ncbi:hypothetical protein FAES_0400 [Fibrella aestuarina BUZ 2]|uniref:Uncharacterized protein n=1 Tax=Fibrella aestuarina BUZ 2 TaxID=1166018 RepID=I0K2Q9_9BACT|nr:hypothetical protein FAES_0400 [Fibrella aestuarina BUZ 2]
MPIMMNRYDITTAGTLHGFCGRTASRLMYYSPIATTRLPNQYRRSFLSISLNWLSQRIFFR